jgi:hypothetical protein
MISISGYYEGEYMTVDESMPEDINDDPCYYTPTSAYYRALILTAKRDCKKTRISPFAASLGKDIKVRCAWKNRALEMKNGKEI